MNANEKKIVTTLLDEIIKKAAPRAVTVEKYGGVLYTLKPDEKEGQFCGVFCQNNNVQLAISFGPELDDPKNVLQGTGKTRRHINFAAADDITAKVLVPLLKQAAKLSKSA